MGTQIQQVTMFTALLATALVLGAQATQFYPSLDHTYTGPSNHIVNGEPAAKGDIPHQLSLEVSDDGQGNYRHTCGASLLSEGWALTAAHCVDGRWPDMPFRVVLGQSVRGDNTDQEQTIDIEEVIMHEDYMVPPGAYSNDIAVLRLAEDAIMNDFVQPAKLADPEDDVAFESARCWSSGWGKEDGRDQGIPDNLM